MRQDEKLLVRFVLALGNALRGMVYVRLDTVVQIDCCDAEDLFLFQS